MSVDFKIWVIIGVVAIMGIAALVFLDEPLLGGSLHDAFSGAGGGGGSSSASSGRGSQVQGIDGKSYTVTGDWFGLILLVVILFGGAWKGINLLKKRKAENASDSQAVDEGAKGKRPRHRNDIEVKVLLGKKPFSGVTVTAVGLDGTTTIGEATTNKEGIAKVRNKDKKLISRITAETPETEVRTKNVVNPTGKVTLIFKAERAKKTGEFQAINLKLITPTMEPVKFDKGQPDVSYATLTIEVINKWKGDLDTVVAEIVEGPNWLSFNNKSTKAKITLKDSNKIHLTEEEGDTDFVPLPVQINPVAKPDSNKHIKINFRIPGRKDIFSIRTANPVQIDLDEDNNVSASSPTSTTIGGSGSAGLANLDDVYRIKDEKFYEDVVKAISEIFKKRSDGYEPLFDLFEGDDKWLRDEIHKDFEDIRFKFKYPKYNDRQTIYENILHFDTTNPEKTIDKWQLGESRMNTSINPDFYVTAGALEYLFETFSAPKLKGEVELFLRFFSPNINMGVKEQHFQAKLQEIYKDANNKDFVEIKGEIFERLLDDFESWDADIEKLKEEVLWLPKIINRIARERSMLSLGNGIRGDDKAQERLREYASSLKGILDGNSSQSGLRDLVNEAYYRFCSAILEQYTDETVVEKFVESWVDENIIEDTNPTKERIQNGAEQLLYGTFEPLANFLAVMKLYVFLMDKLVYYLLDDWEAGEAEDSNDFTDGIDNSIFK
ncbi:MAG: hypothetical protein ABIG20_03815 [archaeon]